MLPSILGSVLFLCLAVLLALFYWDERFPVKRYVPCEIRNGRTVTVTIIHGSVVAKLLKRLTKDTYTLTLWHRVYVAGDWLVPRGVRHELEHVRQWHDRGVIGFIAAYVWHLLRGGFDNNPLEREARLSAGQSLGRR